MWLGFFLFNTVHFTYKKEKHLMKNNSLRILCLRLLRESIIIIFYQGREDNIMVSTSRVTEKITGIDQWWEYHWNYEGKMSAHEFSCDVLPMSMSKDDNSEIYAFELIEFGIQFILNGQNKSKCFRKLKGCSTLFTLNCWLEHLWITRVSSAGAF